MLTENEAEIAVVVSDFKQGKGLGTELLRRLIDVARAEKLERVVANILPENLAMRSLAKRFQFQTQPTGDPSIVVAVLKF